MQYIITSDRSVLNHLILTFYSLNINKSYHYSFCSDFNKEIFILKTPLTRIERYFFMYSEIELKIEAIVITIGCQQFYKKLFVKDFMIPLNSLEKDFL